MLQKIIFRHNDSADKLATQTINAGTNSFMAMIKAPILFLMQYFGLAKGVSLDKLSEEISARTQVADSENDINEGLSDSEGDYDSLDKEENLNHACASDKELSWS